MKKTIFLSILSAVMVLSADDVSGMYMDIDEMDLATQYTAAGMGARVFSVHSAPAPVPQQGQMPQVSAPVPQRGRLQVNRDELADSEVNVQELLVLREENKALRRDYEASREETEELKRTLGKKVAAAVEEQETRSVAARKEMQAKFETEKNELRKTHEDETSRLRVQLEQAEQLADQNAKTVRQLQDELKAKEAELEATKEELSKLQSTGEDTAAMQKELTAKEKELEETKRKLGEKQSEAEQELTKIRTLLLGSFTEGVYALVPNQYKIFEGKQITDYGELLSYLGKLDHLKFCQEIIRLTTGITKRTSAFERRAAQRKLLLQQELTNSNPDSAVQQGE